MKLFKSFITLLIGFLLTYGMANAGVYLIEGEIKPMGSEELGASVLQVYQGGTGAQSFATGECLVGNGTGAITTQICGAGGGGGSSIWSTTTPMSVYYYNLSYPLVVGNTATGTDNTLFEVWGNVAFGTIASGTWAGDVIDISDYTNLTEDVTGLSLTGDELTLDAGYEIPQTTSISNWNTAYGWGDHDGLYDVLGQATSTLSSHTSTYNHANYDTAYGWGNHASAGYFDALSDFTGTLTDTKYCTYDSANGEIDCNSEGGSSATSTWEFATSTATASQTDFDLPFSYTVGDGSLEVYVNGLRMTVDDDYTEASTTAISFVSGREEGDKLVFQVSGGATAGSGGEGTVTSVAMTVPTGLTVAGSPVTTSGTLSVSLTAGYIIPLSASTTQWNTAYNWGDHDGLYDPLGQATSTLSSHTSAYNHDNYDTAYGWGDHATAGYNPQAFASSTYVWASDWTTIDNYPTGCTNQFVRTIGDTLTCATVDISADTNLTAGTNITLSGDTLNVDDAFVANTSDTMTGDLTVNGDITAGATTTTATLDVTDGSHGMKVIPGTATTSLIFY